jgi:ferric-dicitrate binding protein FerR (iron transport regulator)
MNEESRSSERDDASIEALMRAVGSRPMPSAQSVADARSAVEAEWRATVAARTRRRRFTTFAAAAGVAVAAVAVWIARPALEPGQEAVATVARVVGEVQQNRGDGRWTPLATTDSLGAGSQLKTGASGRAALRLDSGVELRLDSRTLVAFEDVGRATLSSGAVYVDSGSTPGTPSPDFLLETPAGQVSHLGTQYEARLRDDHLQVGVREGRVRISAASGDVVGDAGEQLTLSDGQVSRSALPTTAAEWAWVSRVTPPFDIEGRSVESFLVWAARETGRTIVYGSPDAARQARQVTLTGTVEGLSPEEAVTAVLSTTTLQPQIGVERIRIDAAGR